MTAEPGSAACPDDFATQIRAPHQVTQTILHDPELNARGVYGNCLQAAFASLLGMPLEAVPHFVAFGSWDTALALWLADIGLTRIVEERDSIPTTGLCLVSGMTVRGVRHTVVAIEGEVWDPHPSRAGLETVDEVWWLEPRRVEAQSA